MGLEWNSGMQLACAMWALTAMSLALVGLRLYTRIRIIKFVGAEDHMYAWTGLFLLLFTCSIQVGVQRGLGRSFWSLGLDDSSDAIFWTYVANTFAITGNAMAKLSMGLFLLRVVQITWQRVALGSSSPSPPAPPSPSPSCCGTRPPPSRRAGTR